MLTRADCKSLLKNIDSTVRKSFYDPFFIERSWDSLLEQYRAPIIQASHEDEFCGEVNRLLAELSPRAATVFGPHPKLDSAFAINATFRAVNQEGGRRWMFQDVPAKGAAAKAGVLPGDILALVGKRFIGPPHAPKFCLGQKIDLRVSRRGTARLLKMEIDISKRGYVDEFLFSPRLADSFLDNHHGEIGYLKVPFFEGQYGIGFARRLRKALLTSIRDVERLVIDLRGNPGGGRGALRLMSYLTPSKLCVGYTVDGELAREPFDASCFPRLAKVPTVWSFPFTALRLAKKRSMVIETEGLGPQKFHGRTVILMNEHSRGASEMVAKFAQDNVLAKMVGTRTPGECLPRRTFEIGKGYRLTLPIADYVSWSGIRVEGVGVQPEVPVDWCSESAIARKDIQYERAMEVARSL